MIKLFRQMGFEQKTLWIDIALTTKLPERLGLKRNQEILLDIFQYIYKYLHYLICKVAGSSIVIWLEHLLRKQKIMWIRIPARKTTLISTSWSYIFVCFSLQYQFIQVQLQDILDIFKEQKSTAQLDINIFLYLVAVDFTLNNFNNTNGKEHKNVYRRFDYDHPFLFNLTRYIIILKDLKNGQKMSLSSLLIMYKCCQMSIPFIL